MACGDQSVPPLGMMLMPQWCVDSLGTLEKVSVCDILRVYCQMLSHSYSAPRLKYTRNIC